MTPLPYYVYAFNDLLLFDNVQLLLSLLALRSMIHMRLLLKPKKNSFFMWASASLQQGKVLLYHCFENKRETIST